MVIKTTRRLHWSHMEHSTKNYVVRFNSGISSQISTVNFNCPLYPGALSHYCQNKKVGQIFLSTQHDKGDILCQKKYYGECALLLKLKKNFLSVNFLSQNRNWMHFFFFLTTKIFQMVSSPAIPLGLDSWSILAFLSPEDLWRIFREAGSRWNR